MAYDPFARGPHPVGVRTLFLHDAARGDRALPTEVWYPAGAAYADRDLDEASQDRYELVPGLPAVAQSAVREAAPAGGRAPLVVFSHGYGGHRRQSTFLCTHLASHGYVVAAMDHTGNTILDVIRAVFAAQSGGPRREPDAALREFIALRPADASFTIDAVLASDLGALVDQERIGMAGHSFGGWTTLVTTARDPRIRAALPLAPAGGASPLPATLLRDGLDFAWGREVPTLFLVADRDTLLPLDGMHELLARTPSAGKRMVVLRRADHMHFCDRVEQVHEMFRTMPQDPVFQPLQRSIPPIAELCPGEHAYVLVQGLGLAHMDAALRDVEAAGSLVAGTPAALEATLAERGVTVTVY